MKVSIIITCKLCPPKDDVDPANELLCLEFQKVTKDNMQRIMDSEETTATEDTSLAGPDKDEAGTNTPQTPSQVLRVAGFSTFTGSTGKKAEDSACLARIARLQRPCRGISFVRVCEGFLSKVQARQALAR